MNSTLYFKNKIDDENKEKKKEKNKRKYNFWPR